MRLRTPQFLRCHVIQGDKSNCDKWVCLWITFKHSSIFRFHTLWGFLIKATNNQNRHFWLIWANLVFSNQIHYPFSPFFGWTHQLFLCISFSVGQSELFFGVTRRISPKFIVCKCKFVYFHFWGAHPQKGPKLTIECIWFFLLRDDIQDQIVCFLNIV